MLGSGKRWSAMESVTGQQLGEARLKADAEAGTPPVPTDPLQADHMGIGPPMGIRSVPVVEAKARFSALLAEVEAGLQVRITRRGRTVARLVPEPVIHAASLFEPFWADPSPDLVLPDDSPPESARDLG